MSKAKFEGWLDELRQLAWDEFDCNLSQCPGYSRSEAREFFDEGMLPEDYLVELQDRQGSSMSLTEILRDV